MAHAKDRGNDGKKKRKKKDKPKLEVSKSVVHHRVHSTTVEQRV